MNAMIKFFKSLFQTQPGQVAQPPAVEEAPAKKPRAPRKPRVAIKEPKKREK